MAIKSVLAVVERTVLDRSFRDTFFANPTTALSGYSLTKDETKLLLALDRDVFFRNLTRIEADIQRVGSFTEPLWNDFVATCLTDSTQCPVGC